MKCLVRVAVAAMLLAAPETASAQPATLKAAVFVPPNVVCGAIFKRWADAVNERGKDLVRIESVGPEAIPAFEQWNAVKNGVTDIHVGPPAYYVGTMPEGDAAILSDLSVPEQRKNGAFAELDRLHQQKLNAKLLTAYSDGITFHIYTMRPANLANKEKPFDGFTLRATPNFKAFFEALGARTVNITLADVYSALERRIVEGYGFPIWGVEEFGWVKFTKFRYDPGFFNVICNVLVNLDRWNKLDQRQQKFLVDMAEWLEAEWPKWREDIGKREADVQTKGGIQVVNLGPAHRQKAHETYWDFLAKRSPDGIAKLRPMLTKP